MHPIGEKYIRKSALPTIFCPGCGHGTVLNAFLRAVDSLDIFETLGLVSGIGCSSWTPVFVNADVMHTLHGRALAFATGLKIATPDLNVVVFSGDGDCVGIGGNHLIHAARRNIDMTVLMLDNLIYGMTGGQVSPTTPTDAKSQTTPFGNPEPEIDACALVASVGATHVARYTTAQPRALVKGIKAAIEHKGFSFLHIISQCPTQAGRYIYGITKPAEHLRMIRKQSITFSAARKSSKEDLQGKIITGILHECSDRPEFVEKLNKLRRS
jgi:2-oxoglutarate/2-oxoacid ferredoxin oxidoreductase subunit beta